MCAFGEHRSYDVYELMYELSMRALLPHEREVAF